MPLAFRQLSCSETRMNNQTLFNNLIQLAEAWRSVSDVSAAKNNFKRRTGTARSQEGADTGTRTMNSSGATSRVRWLKGEKYRRFETRLRPRPRGLVAREECT